MLSFTYKDRRRNFQMTSTVFRPVLMVTCAFDSCRITIAEKGCTEENTMSYFCVIRLPRVYNNKQI